MSQYNPKFFSREHISSISEALNQVLNGGTNSTHLTEEDTTSGRESGFGKGKTLIQPDNTWDEVARKDSGVASWAKRNNLDPATVDLKRENGKIYANGVEMTSASTKTSGYATGAKTRSEMNQKPAATPKAAPAPPTTPKREGFGVMGRDAKDVSDLELNNAILNNVGTDFGGKVREDKRQSQKYIQARDEKERRAAERVTARVRDSAGKSDADAAAPMKAAPVTAPKAAPAAAPKPRNNYYPNNYGFMTSPEESPGNGFLTSPAGAPDPNDYITTPTRARARNDVQPMRMEETLVEEIRNVIRRNWK